MGDSLPKIWLTNWVIFCEKNTKKNIFWQFFLKFGQNDHISLFAMPIVEEIMSRNLLELFGKVSSWYVLTLT